MNFLPLVPEAAAATWGAVRPLSGLVREGAAQFADLFDGARPAPLPGDATTSGDDFPFSSEALQLRLADQIAQGGLEFGGPASSLSELRGWSDDQLTSLHDRLAEKLRQAGIDLTEDFELAVRSVDGSIAVSGDHPQRREIEELLSNDSQLSQEIHQLVATLDLLRAAADNLEFAEAYDDDPREAVANHRALFAPHDHSSSRLLVDDVRIRIAR